MGPEQWKGEREEQEGGEAQGAPREASDPREEEGWSQPESSAVKTPPMPETEQPGGE